MKSAIFWEPASIATYSRWFLARGFFYPEDLGDTLLRNVCTQKTVFFIGAAVETSDLTQDIIITHGFCHNSAILHVSVFLASEYLSVVV
jgi:hypothetical protein